MPDSWGPPDDSDFVPARPFSPAVSVNSEDCMEDDVTTDGSIGSLLDAAEDVALADEYHRDWYDLDTDYIEGDIFDMDPPSSPIKERPPKRRLMQH